MNGDGVVNVFDLVFVAGAIGVAADGDCEIVSNDLMVAERRLPSQCQRKRRSRLSKNSPILSLQVSCRFGTGQDYLCRLPTRQLLALQMSRDGLQAHRV